ncbi:hypothetical protein [Bdellovibrio reynosensis]|uniref:Pilus assembly protein n=1 Tax=Bdellovibrio reynosensis TaxID=2835041 RepID=A0ABY4C5Y0_9BACT|nr:hypothetical protein [Bdellovibrio reynosensis]UOF00300.1 hypothetical protein MNR06_11365 [Bdellovibrio reynosensis]
MLKQRRKSHISNEKGMAVFEMIPIIVVIVLFLNFSLGFFGAIHTGILNSIAARNYAFETFRNRTSLVYFSNLDSSQTRYEYSKSQMRVHGITAEKETGQKWVATSRLIDRFSFDKRAADIEGNSKNVHSGIRNMSDGRNTTVGVNPIWIKTTYGLCLTSTCGS